MSFLFARALACALVAVALASCGTTRSTPPRNFNLAGYSPSYKGGHADGCASADGAQRRDARRYRDDADYMMGWNDGRSACMRRK